uniref:Serine/threonine protein kinase n=1 Tax=Schlesneria paludicola TaxID=360056 RepID=A0A7C4LMN3_9PLAN
MSVPKLPKLEELLLDLRLVEPAQLQECRRSLGAHVSSERLLQELESASFLTSYQTGKLRKGETDGLRLGRYKLLYRNASGSFARVFRACSIDTGQIVAIKLLRQRYAADPRVVNLFRREGELGKRLKHKNIVPIYEVASEGNQHYFTMEFVEGGNFRDFIKIRQKFSPQEATKYVLDMAEGLEYALSLGLTHRDLKLSNVLLSSQGVAKLVDFGLAGQDSALAAIEEEVDRAIEYATLEKNTAAPENDPRSDLYFLGAIYYELLTGQPPYPPTRSREERRQFSRYRNVRPVRSVDPGLPLSVAEIVTRLMDIHPDDRYQTPTEVIGDLRRVLNGGGHGPAPAATDADTAARSAAPVVICIESRLKQQDALRDYLTKHGFRVLVMGDPVRALNRIDSEAPYGVVIIADALESEEDVVGVFKAAVTRCKKSRTPVVLALSAKLAHLREQLIEPPGAKVLVNAVTLRDVRNALAELNSGR